MPVLWNIPSRSSMKRWPGGAAPNQGCRQPDPVLCSLLAEEDLLAFSLVASEPIEQPASS